MKLDMSDAVELLGKNDTRIKTMDLSHQNISDAAAARLGKALEANTTIRHLDLYNNKIGDAGAASLGRALGVNASVQRLFLHNNSIGDAGATSLAESLRANATLRDLFLHNNDIGDDGAAALAGALGANASLRVLGLWSNGIGDAGAAGFAGALRINASLRRLYLHNNKIGDAGAEHLLKTLEAYPSLRVLNLGMNAIDKDLVEKINGIVKRNALSANVPAVNAKRKASAITGGEELGHRPQKAAFKQMRDERTVEERSAVRPALLDSSAAEPEPPLSANDLFAWLCDAESPGGGVKTESPRQEHRPRKAAFQKVQNKKILEERLSSLESSATEPHSSASDSFACAFEAGLASGGIKTESPQQRHRPQKAAFQKVQNEQTVEERLTVRLSSLESPATEPHSAASDSFACALEAELAIGGIKTESPQQEHRPQKAAFQKVQNEQTMEERTTVRSSSLESPAAEPRLSASDSFACAFEAGSADGGIKTERHSRIAGRGRDTARDPGRMTTDQNAKKRCDELEKEVAALKEVIERQTNDLASLRPTVVDLCGENC